MKALPLAKIFRWSGILIGITLIFGGGFADLMGIGNGGFGAKQALIVFAGILILLAVLFGKGFFQKSAMILAGLVFSFVIIEIVLRIFGNPFGFRIRGDQIVLPTYRQYEIHNTKIDKLDEYIIHKKNSLGFRGPEPPASFESYLTIVTVGGSTTECYYLSEGQTWPDLLSENLKNSFEHIWLNNAGLDGHSTYGHTILMDDYINRLQPKVALFLVGANDRGMSELGNLESSWIGVSDDVTQSRKFLNSAVQHSEVFSLIYNLTRFAITTQKNIGHSFKGLENFPVYEMTNLEKEAAIQMHIPLLDDYAERLTSLIHGARANGIEPVLVTQPALYGDVIDATTGIDLAKISVNKFNGETQWETLELYNDITRDVGAEYNVLVIDLAKELEKRFEALL